MDGKIEKKDAPCEKNAKATKSIMRIPQNIF